MSDKTIYLVLSNPVRSKDQEFNALDSVAMSFWKPMGPKVEA